MSCDLSTTISVLCFFCFNIISELLEEDDSDIYQPLLNSLATNVCSLGSAIGGLCCDIVWRGISFHISGLSVLHCFTNTVCTNVWKLTSTLLFFSKLGQSGPILTLVSREEEHQWLFHVVFMISSHRIELSKEFLKYRRLLNSWEPGDCLSLEEEPDKQETLKYTPLSVQLFFQRTFQKQPDYST